MPIPNMTVSELRARGFAVLDEHDEAITEKPDADDDKEMTNYVRDLASRPNGQRYSAVALRFPPLAAIVPTEVLKNTPPGFMVGYIVGYGADPHGRVVLMVSETPVDEFQAVVYPEAMTVVTYMHGWTPERVRVIVEPRQ